MGPNDHIDESILANVLNQHESDELRVVAEQVVREIKSGGKRDEVLTQAQFTLGLSFDDTARLAEMADMSMDKHAGLKSTLRELRRKLNKFEDKEDIDGMNKLITCIEGVERQLDQKSKSKEERKKKREEKSKEQEANGSDNGGESEEAEESEAVEASVDVTAAPPGEGSLPPSPGPEDPLGPQAPLPTGPEMAEHSIDLKSRLNKLKMKIEEMTKEQEQLMQIPELRQTVQAEMPLLMEWLDTLPDKRILMETAEQKWSVLVSQAKTTPRAAQLLKAFEKRLIEEADNGTENADKFLRILRSMAGSPKYKLEKKPYVTTGPTPKPLQEEPHMRPPSKESSYKVLSDENMLSGALSALKQQAQPLLSALDEAISSINDLIDVADNQLGIETMQAQPAI